MTSVKVTSIKTQPDTPQFVAFLRNPEALLFHYLIEQGASLVAQTVNNVLTMQEIWVQFLGQEDPLEKGMATTPVFLPGEFHEQRSLASYGPWGRKESDTTEQLTQ